ncbi:MAG: acyltransferase [Bacteroidota bacterium]|nr:acyltransferase [Bacteroidota bacterium]
MKGKIKSFLKQRPLLLKYARLVYDRSLWGYSYKKRVRGSSNKIEIGKTSILSKCRFKIQGKNNLIQIGESNILRNVTFYVKGDNNHINLEDSVQFNRDGLIWVEDYECSIEVGEKTTFEGTHLAATEPHSKISIGNDCMFAYDIDVRTGDSHSILDLESGNRINYAEDVIIGNHVWVGSHVSILKGTEINKNSIVATRSVVTKTFLEKNVVIGGSPARIIKKGVDWDRRRLA